MTMIYAKARRTSFSARNKRQFSFTTGFIEIAVIAVAPTGRASLVYSYVQTRLKGRYNGK